MGASKMLTAALEYAERGWPVFPCRARGKTPLTAHGFKDATTDPGRIREWFETKWPSANVGVATGRVVVLDVDGAQGEQSFADLVAQNGPLPETREAKTGKGRHVYFYPNGTAIRNDVGRKLGSGLDVRGDGGYVIAPPSVHESGRLYEWTNESPVAEIPHWLAEKLVSPTAESTDAATKPSPAGERIPRGQHDVTLTSIAGRLRRDGIEERAIAAALVEICEKRCEDYGSDYRAMCEKIARSVCRYEVGLTPEDRLTEAGAAERFARRHGEDVRYDHRRARWLLWDTHRWRPDNDGATTRLAIEFARAWQREAVDIVDPEKKTAALKLALRLERGDALRGMLLLARDLKPISEDGSGWDAEPELLGAPNGVIDLRTGALRPGRREDRITMSTGVDYDKEAQSEEWDKAVRAALPDEALRNFVSRAVGYSCTGDTERDCWFLANGSGRNGKGTVLQPIRHALGDYAMELPASIFDARVDRVPYELAKLPGSRMALSSESGDTIRLNHDRIKQLTGGDSISAGDKYQRAFEFTPVCKLWMSCNKKPRVRDDTPAFWSRVKLVPFEVSFAGREVFNLRPMLTYDPNHQAGVLAWVVRGAVAYLKDGLGTAPEKITAATQEYREEEDPLAVFLADTFKVTDDERDQVPAGTTYSDYEAWALTNKLPSRDTLGSRTFGTLMKTKFKHKKPGPVCFYLGLKRKTNRTERDD